MKKLTLLVVLLVAVGMVGFALEVKPTFSLSGSATLTWGVALGTTATTGFTNAGTATLTVNLLAADGTDTHAGKGKVYGSITISNVEAYFGGTADATANEGGGAPSVAATVTFDPLTIGINGAPSMYVDAAGVIEDSDGTGTYADGVQQDEGSFYSAAYAGKGTWVKYAGKTFWVKADLVSKDTHTANTSNAYAFGGEAEAVLGPITADLGAFYGFGTGWASTPVAGYFKLASTIPGFGPITAGFDFASGTAFVYEVGATAQFNLNKDATAYVSAALNMNSDTAKATDVRVKLMVPAATLAGAANFDLTFWMLDLGSTSVDMAALVNAGYKVDLEKPMYLKPGVQVSFAQTGGTTAVNKLQVIPSVVLGLADAPAVTLTTKWTSGDLLATTPGMGAITTALAVTY